MELINLVRRAQAGDSQAVQDICLRFTGLVKKYAFQPHIRPIAEEAQAQGWLAVVQAIRHYDEHSGVPFAGFMESRVKYGIWNLFKGERRRWQHEGQLDPGNDEDFALLNLLPDGTNVAEEVELKFLSHQLMTAITRLPDKQQLVIMRTIVDTERLTTIALELGITIQGVSNLRKRGLARLQILCAGMYKDIRQ